MAMIDEGLRRANEANPRPGQVSALDTKTVLLHLGASIAIGRPPGICTEQGCGRVLTEQSGRRGTCVAPTTRRQVLRSSSLSAS